MKKRMNAAKAIIGAQEPTVFIVLFICKVVKMTGFL